MEYCRNWLKKLRILFTGAIIRRTLNSLDNAGDRISKLPPYQEHVMHVHLTKHELESLDALAGDLANDPDASSIKALSSVSIMSIPTFKNI